MDARKRTLRKRAVILLTATGLMLSVGSGVALAEVNRIIGTMSNDVLIGTSSKDIIQGRAGHDVIRGQGGDDRLNGGKGHDRIAGNQGNDRIKGGLNQDVLRGGPGNDFIHADDGARDQVFCGSGNDTVMADSKDVIADDCENVTVRQLTNEGENEGPEEENEG